ncbi:MAG TPA: hypothetical protein VKO42_00840, partial [Patescibacteria group bacterium]|nr:hypothetical protein [Patescibacteria group bacterium]
MYYKISSIMFNNGQKASNASEIFIAQPDEYKESLAGRLFLLLEIESSKSKALKIANFLVNNINYNYYQNEKILLREKIADLKVEHIFETALANVNKDLVEFLQQEKIKISPYAINLTVGVIYKNQLHLSSLGKNRNLLIYPVRKEEQTHYKITDIEKRQEKSARAISFTKLFSDVVSGPLPEDGYYFLANEALTEHLSEKQLTEAITKLPPAGAATHIKNIIQQINVPVNFLGIIIKNTVNTSEEPEKEDKKGSSHLFNLDRTKEDTEQILKPSGVVNLKGLARKSGKLFSSSENSGQTSAPSPARREKWKKTGAALKKLGALIAVLLRKISRITVRTGKKIFQRPPRSEEVSIEKPPKLLGWKSKLILGGVVVFLLAFLVSLSFNSSENKNQEISQEIKNLTEQVKKTQNRIEANLLYGNEDKARTLLEEVRATMLELKNKLEDSSAPKEKFSEYNQLVQKIKDQVKEIRHVVPFSAQERLNLAENGQTTEAGTIYPLNGSWYISDKNNSRIYKTNPDNNQVQTLEAPDLSSLKNNNYTEASDKLYYLISGGVLELDPEND